MTSEVDADDLVTVGGGRRWESRTVPKKRTRKDESGERVLKRRRDEDGKPATCTACGNKFFSKAKPVAARGGFYITCGGKKNCRKVAAKYD